MSAPILEHFDTSKMPDMLAMLCSPFDELARRLDKILPDGPEKSVALRKLLESQDAAVRAKFPISTRY